MERQRVDAFAVIRDAMKDQDRVALARIVLTNREHVMMIEPLGKGLLGTTLRYPYELRDEDEFFDHIKSPKITKDMVELAGHILHTKAAHFDPSKFKDEYEDALKALVRRKAAGKPIKVAASEEKPDNVINLMDALKASLKGKGAAKRAQAPPCAALPRIDVHRRKPTARRRGTARRAENVSFRHCGGPSIRISLMSTGPSKRGKPSPVHQKTETMTFNYFCFAG